MLFLIKKKLKRTKTLIELAYGGSWIIRPFSLCPRGLYGEQLSWESQLSKHVTFISTQVWNGLYSTLISHWMCYRPKIAKTNVMWLIQFREKYLVKGQWLYHISIQIGSFVRTNISRHDHWVFLLCKYCDHIYRSMRIIWESMWTNARKCKILPLSPTGQQQRTTRKVAFCKALVYHTSALYSW